MQQYKKAIVVSSKQNSVANKNGYGTIANKKGNSKHQQVEVQFELYTYHV
jgi:hypothetical protein